MKEQVKRWAGALAVVAAFGIMGIPDAMAATTTITFTGSDFYIPRPVAASDQVGVRRLLATYELPADQQQYIGTVCTFRVTAANGDSVHPNNFGVIVTDGNESDVLGTESQPNVTATRLEDATLILGPNVRLYNVMMPDSEGNVSTSVDYTVSATCTIEDDTTTTTATTPSTTTPTTTSTTTTPSSTTTSIPTSTSIPPATTTTAPTGSTTTTVPPVTTQECDEDHPSWNPETETCELPFTGLDDHLPSLAFAGAMLALLGGFLLRARRDNATG